MDLGLYLRVIARFWYVVVLGLALALILALVSYYRVDFHGFDGRPTLTHREQDTWRASATLMLTQRGFPWGRTTFPQKLNKETGQFYSPDFADPSRFTALAATYAQLAGSDAIRSRVSRRGLPADATYTATPVVEKLGGSSQFPQLVTLPEVQITGTASTGRGAIAIARRASSAFRRYLVGNQNAARIPPKQRILVQTISAPAEANLASGRKPTVPIVVFLAVLVGTLALVFVLENLRPRARPRRLEAELSAAAADRSDDGQHEPQPPRARRQSARQRA